MKKTLLSLLVAVGLFGSGAFAKNQFSSYDIPGTSYMGFNSISYASYINTYQILGSFYFTNSNIHNYFILEGNNYTILNYPYGQHDEVNTAVYCYIRNGDVHGYLWTYGNGYVGSGGFGYVRFVMHAGLGIKNAWYETGARSTNLSEVMPVRPEVSFPSINYPSKWINVGQMDICNNVIIGSYSDQSNKDHAFIAITQKKKNQSILFQKIPRKYDNSKPFSLIATTPSNLPITFTSSDPSVASINGKIVTIHKEGQILILANQMGNDSWNEANPVTQVFKITKAPS